MTDYLTIAEVADEIREKPDTVRRRCKTGQIKAIKLGKSWRIPREELDRFMRPGSTKPSPRDRLTERQRQALA
jgi:excisionase family DNA binding protein